MPHDAFVAPSSRPPVSVEEIADHPGYLAARRLYCARFLALFDRNPFLSRLLTDTGRYLVFTLSVILDANHDDARRETWFTVGRLKQSMAAFGAISPRQIDHLVERLIAVGFLRAAPAPADRRVRLLSVGERMAAHDRDWLAADYVVLDALRPDEGYARRLAEDPRMRVEIRRQSLALLPEAAALLARLDEFLLFFGRAGGLMVLEALFEAALAEPDAPARPVPFAEAADRFGLSRSHVRGLMRDAEAAGLLRLHGRGGRLVEILPRLWRCDAIGHGIGARLRDVAYRRAVDALAAPARPDDRAAR